MMLKKLKKEAISFFLIISSGCSVIFGNIKPSEERSTSYKINDLSKQGADWQSIELADKADYAFQSQSTSSTISINSACKRTKDPLEKKETLKELTRELLFGIMKVQILSEKEIKISNNIALNTVLEGVMNNQKVKIQTIVFQKDPCVYDLMYITKPELFQKNEKDFMAFSQSLSLD